MKYFIGFLFFLSVNIVSAQIKYTTATDAGLIVTVDASGNIDTISAEYTEPKEYIALLSQSSTGAPTVVKLIKNTLGGTLTWAYTSSGNYTASIVAATAVFVTDKTVGEAFLQARGSNPRYYIVGRASDSTVVLTAMNSSLAATDPATTNYILVNIKVYY